MGMTRAEISRKFDAIVDFAGVREFIDTPVKRYSSGMNARLGFAIAAHLDPDVLLIDEVLSVGDVGFQEKCVTRMRELIARGVPLVFVSHNLTAVVDLCTRAILIDHGVVQAEGDPAEVVGEFRRGRRAENAPVGDGPIRDHRRAAAAGGRRGLAALPDRPGDDDPACTTTRASRSNGRMSPSTFTARTGPTAPASTRAWTTARWARSRAAATSTWSLAAVAAAGCYSISAGILDPAGAAAARSPRARVSVHGRLDAARLRLRLPRTPMAAHRRGAGWRQPRTPRTKSAPQDVPSAQEGFGDCFGRRTRRRTCPSPSRRW